MGCSAPCPGPEHTCDRREACPGGWAGGQQASQWMGGGGLTGVLALSQGILTNPKSSLLVQGGAAFANMVRCHGNCWGAAAWEDQWSGRAGGTLDLGRGVPQTLTPRAIVPALPTWRLAPTSERPRVRELLVVRSA